MPIHRAFAVSAAKGIYCRQYTKLFAGNICNPFFIQSPYTAAPFDFACFEFVSCNRAGAAAVATAQPTGSAFSVFRSAEDREPAEALAAEVFCPVAVGGISLWNTAAIFYTASLQTPAIHRDLSPAVAATESDPVSVFVALRALNGRQSAKTLSLYITGFSHRLPLSVKAGIF